jgi:CRP-like cAMP-binding protein
MVARADVPVVELALLRSVPVTAALAGPELERLARGLRPQPVQATAAVCRQGELGDRLYVVASGVLDVLAGGRPVNEFHRGDAFGEIALLYDCPRTATVRARGDALVYALERDDFLAAVAGNGAFRQDARRLAATRLGDTRRVAEAAP